MIKPGKQIDADGSLIARHPEESSRGKPLSGISGSDITELADLPQSTKTMKNLLVLILLVSCGCGFVLGGEKTKEQAEIPAGLLGKGPIVIKKIKRYYFDTREVTLSFIIAGANKGQRISFLVTFSRFAELESRASLRVKKGKSHNDYRLDLGSGFAKELAQRISLKLPGDSKVDSPDPYHDRLLEELGPPRIKALRLLLGGEYSWENPPK